MAPVSSTPAVSQDDGSDDDRKRPATVALEVKPAAFGRKKRHKDSTLKTCEVIKINPTDGKEPLKAIVVVATQCMMDKHMCGRLFEKKGSEQKVKFLEQTGAVNRAVKVIDENGKTVSRAGSARAWDLQGLVIPLEEMLTDEEIVTFVNETLAPLTWNHYLEDDVTMKKGCGEEKNLPKLRGDSTDDITTVDTWDKALAQVDDIVFIANKEVEDLFAWIKEDPTHLYNLFTVGKVPMQWYKKKYQFPIHYLQGDDVKNFNEYGTGKQKK